MLRCPRRSLTFVPGSILESEDEPLLKYASQSMKLGIATEYISDSLVFDLEDSVAPEFKERAAEMIAGFLGNNENLSGVEIIVRFDPHADCVESQLDYAAECEGAIDAFMIPKIEATSIDFVQSVGDRFGKSLILIFETPQGIRQKDQVMAVIKERALDISAFIIGLDDLSAALRISRNDFFEVAAYSSILADFVCFARAFGAVPIGGVYNELSNREGLIAEAEYLRRLGFQGSACVFPAYVESLKSTFTPNADDVKRASSILTGLRNEGKKGRGWTFFEGTKYDLADIKKFEWIVRFYNVCREYDTQLESRYSRFGQ